MGLLDDAIREHLELKRSHGADPNEVAREEHEALEPVFADGPGVDRPEDPSAPTAASEDAAEAATEDAVGAGPEPAAAVPPAGDFSSVGQETAEFDMRAVLAEDGDPAASSEPEDGSGQERLTFE